jgi:hypothetical protein
MKGPIELKTSETIKIYKVYENFLKFNDSPAKAGRLALGINATVKAKAIYFTGCSSG